MGAAQFEFLDTLPLLPGRDVLAKDHGQLHDGEIREGLEVPEEVPACQLRKARPSEWATPPTLANVWSHQREVQVGMASAAFCPIDAVDDNIFHELQR